MAEINFKDKKFSRQTAAKMNPYASQEEQASMRIVKNIGYNIETPVTAHESYIDSKCPFTGDVNIRGGFIEGKVVKMKAEKTIVVKKETVSYVSKYKRYKRAHTNFSVHMSPCFKGLVKVGDTVLCGHTRPLSKTKFYVLVKIIKNAAIEDEVLKNSHQ